MVVTTIINTQLKATNFNSTLNSTQYIDNIMKHNMKYET